MIFIRPATKNDCPTIRNMALKTWRLTYSDILSPEQSDYMLEQMYSIRSLHRQMEVGKHQFFMAFEDETPLGYVSVEQQSETLFHLHKLYVLPDLQGKGIGKTLIEKVFDYARKKTSGKKCAVELNVNRYNNARFFYEKIGMTKVSEGDFDIGNGYFMNDYIYRIELPG